MIKHQKTLLWISACVLFVVGFILVMSDSGAGWFLIILGITYIGASTQVGQSWTESIPRRVRRGLVGVSVSLALLVVIVGAILLMK